MLDGRSLKKAARRHSQRQASAPRFACSSLATLTCFGHPNASSELPSKWTALIYQDNYEQMERDAAILGLTLVDEEQQLAEIVAKMPEASAAEIAAVLDGCCSADVQARADVGALIKRGVEVVKGAANMLLPSEARELNEIVRREASTRFGTRQTPLT